MPTVQQGQYAYPVQNNPSASPVSPFAKGTSAAPQAPAGYQSDSLQTQPVARGIQPNIDLLHDTQSKLSPFHRPNGEKVDYLNQPNPTQGPQGPATPATPAAPKEPENIVFVFPVDIPEGPAMANIEQVVAQEVQAVQHPQQALQLVETHLSGVNTTRETANRITWGARYYAAQAAETAEQALEQWDQMNPQQRQAFVAKTHEHRDQAVSLLNEAKKHAITTYNASLKATLTYNHFFTGTGTMIKTLEPEARETIKGALNEGWSRWNGSFEKQWQGKMVEAKGIQHIIDDTSNEVSTHLHRMNAVLSQLH